MINDQRRNDKKTPDQRQTKKSIEGVFTVKNVYCIIGYMDNTVFFTTAITITMHLKCYHTSYNKA